MTVKIINLADVRILPKAVKTSLNDLRSSFASISLKKKRAKNNARIHIPAEKKLMYSNPRPLRIHGTNVFPEKAPIFTIQ